MDGKGDGPSLAKLINETRNLASENAAFCELNGKLTDELRLLRRNESNVQAQLESARASLSAQKAEMAKLNENQHQGQINERELQRKWRQSQENYEVERERAKLLELKVQEQIELRREFEERLKLQRGDIHTLRQENLELLKAKESQAKQLNEARDDIERFKQQQKQTQKSLDEVQFRSADYEHQLSMVKSDLSVTTDRLHSAVDESQLQHEKETRIMADLEGVKSRLQIAEHANHEFEAELVVLKGKLRASQDNVVETNRTLEAKEAELNGKTLKIDHLEDELSRLKLILKQEQDEKGEINVKSEKLSTALKTASEETARLSDELDRADRERLAEREQMRAAHEQAVSLLETEIKDQHVNNARCRGDLDDANELVQRKEATIVDQFKKIEELIIQDGDKEIEIATLREKSATLTKTVNKLQTQLDEQTRENRRLTVVVDEKGKLNAEMIEKLEAEIKAKKQATKEISTLKVSMSGAIRTAREAESALTDLTADQARNLTQTSQLKRQHQMKLSEVEEDHKAQLSQLTMEHTAIAAEMGEIKREWEKRARSAEAKLVTLVNEHDVAVAGVKKLKKRAKLAEREKHAEQLTLLTKVKRQQDDLIFQKDALAFQANKLTFVKLVLSELIIIKKELNEKKPPIMKFRRAALVILAANRLRKRNYAAAHDDYGIGGSSMSLCRRLKCGLQNVQFSRPEINLTNSTFLAEAIRKIIHEQTEKNWKLTNHVASLKKKLKSSTSFMNDLEKRVVSMENTTRSST